MRRIVWPGGLHWGKKKKKILVSEASWAVVRGPFSSSVHCSACLARQYIFFTVSGRFLSFSSTAEPGATYC